MKKFSVDILLKAINQTGAATNAAVANLDKIQSKMDDLNDRAEKFNKIGGGLQSIGVKVGAAGLAMGAGLGYATSRFASFETGIAKTATLLNTDLDTALLNYGGRIQDLSIKSGKSLADLTEGFRLAVSSGFDAEGAMKALEVSSKLAVGGFTGISNGISGLSRMYNAFGRDSSKLEEQAYQLFLADKYGITTIEELTTQVGELAGLFSAAGAKSSEMLSAFASISKLAPSTSEAITQTGALLRSILDPTVPKQMQETLDQLNSKLKDNQKIMIGPEALKNQNLSEWVDKLMNATGGDFSLLYRLFGQEVRAARGVIALTQDIDNYKKQVEEMNNVSDAARFNQEKMNLVLGTSQSAFDRIKTTIDVLSARLGRALAPAFNTFASVLSKVGTLLATFMENNQGLVKVLAYVALGLSAVLVVAGGLITALGTILVAVGGFFAAQATFAGAVAMLTPFIAVLQGAGAALIAFLSGISAPVIGIALAIGAALVAIGSFVYGFFSGLITGLSPVFDVIGKMVDWVGEKISAIVDSIKGFFISIINWIKTALNGLVTLGKGLGLKVGEGISGIFGLDNSAALDKVVKNEDAANKQIVEGKKKGLLDVDALLNKINGKHNSKKGKAFDILDIFGGKEGKFLTSQYTSGGVNENGYATDGITAAVSAGRGNTTSKRSTNIQNVVLPNVTDTNSFMYEMERMSLSMGT